MAIDESWIAECRSAGLMRISVASSAFLRQKLYFLAFLNFLVFLLLKKRRMEMFFGCVVHLIFYVDWAGFMHCSWSEQWHQRWPKSLFQTPTPLLFPDFEMRAQIRVLQFFKFENPTPVQTAATIINPTLIHPYFYLRTDNTDSCYCRNWKMSPGPVFPKFLNPSPDPGPKEKRRILLESTSVIRFGPTFGGHQWWPESIFLTMTSLLHLEALLVSWASVSTCVFLSINCSDSCLPISST